MEALVRLIPKSLSPLMLQFQTCLDVDALTLRESLSAARLTTPQMGSWLVALPLLSFNSFLPLWLQLFFGSTWKDPDEIEQKNGI